MNKIGMLIYLYDIKFNNKDKLGFLERYNN